jgi:hypothetical protein
MLFAEAKFETKSFEETGTEGDADLISPAVAEISDEEPTESDLYRLYEQIAETRPGTRDAQIFESIREWTFSDFSVPPHKFAGISALELAAWQKRHSINLSAGHIRPARIDIARGYAWGTIRRGDHVNGRHTVYGPPSREEMVEMMGSAG